jgi:hypothetical protein
MSYVYPGFAKVWSAAFGSTAYSQLTVPTPAVCPALSASCVVSTVVSSGVPVFSLPQPETLAIRASKEAAVPRMIVRLVMVVLTATNAGPAESTAWRGVEGVRIDSFAASFGGSRASTQDCLHSSFVAFQ